MGEQRRWFLGIKSTGGYAVKIAKMTTKDSES